MSQKKVKELNKAKELDFSVYEYAPHRPKKNFDRTFFIEKKNLLENFPMHWHKWIELEFVTSGTGKQIIDGVEYDLLPGSAYLLLPTNTHAIFPKGKMEVITLSFDYTFIPSSLFPFISKQHEAIVVNLNDKALKRFIDLSDFLFEEFLDGSEFKNENIASYCSLLLIEFFIQTGHKKDEDESLISPKRQIAQILDYIQQYYSDNPTLTQIAETFHFNTSYFSSFFKKHMGITYKNYLNDVKISNAKKLLLENKLSIIEIALSCGFNSLSNFSNAFKKNTGMTPTEFIKSINNN